MNEHLKQLKRGEVYRNRSFSWIEVYLTRAPKRFPHLQFLDAIANGDELAGSPEETVHLDALHVLQHLVHVSLIIPGLQTQTTCIVGL